MHTYIHHSSNIYVHLSVYPRIIYHPSNLYTFSNISLHTFIYRLAYLHVHCIYLCVHTAYMYTLVHKNSSNVSHTFSHYLQDGYLPVISCLWCGVEAQSDVVVSLIKDSLPSPVITMATMMCLYPQKTSYRSYNMCTCCVIWCKHGRGKSTSLSLLDYSSRCDRVYYIVSLLGNKYVTEGG